MAAIKGVIGFIALIIIVVILWYLTTGLRLPTMSSTTTTVSSSNTVNVINSTKNTTTTILYVQPCASFNLLFNGANTTEVGACSWNGGYLGLWLASGNYKNLNIRMVGADNLSYVNSTINYQCMEFFKNFSIPGQIYKIYAKTGPLLTANQSQNCQYAEVIINQTLSPPSQVYNTFYNANFSSGGYYGWSTTGNGFGRSPLNITYANENPTAGCYVGSPWTNYIGSYVATTYDCGTQVASGNITSSPFYANKAFLNFKIISPQNNFLYVEILSNDTPYILVHYNTYNISLTNASSTFRNVSIPLVTVVDKPIQVRVVADTQIAQNFIAVGDFVLSNKPVQDKGVLQNITFAP